MISSLKSTHIKNLSNKNDKDTIDTKNLFFKEILCPICENKFNTLAVKVDTPRVKSRDSDLFIRYSSENPYFYEVWAWMYRLLSQDDNEKNYLSQALLSFNDTYINEKLQFMD